VSHDFFLKCLFDAQETFLIINNVEKSCETQYIGETVIHIFSGYFDKYKV